MDRKITIYGLFDPETDECLYVGQTVDPKSREADHRNPFRGKHFDFVFKAIRRVNAEKANNAEGEIIAKFRKNGQAKMNKRLRAYQPPATINNSVLVFWTGKEFQGYSEAGRFLGCTAQTVANMAKRGEVKIKATSSRENGKKGGRPKKGGGI